MIIDNLLITSVNFALMIGGYPIYEIGSLNGCVRVHEVGVSEELYV